LDQATSKKKAVAIVTANSATMTTVDPRRTADDVSWPAWQTTVKIDDACRQIDSDSRTIAALGLAHREFSGAVADLE